MRFLVLLFAFALLPSMEVVEVAVHWAAYGDLAHAKRDGHEGAPLGADEHGCSGTFHLCGCHVASALPSSPHRLIAKLTSLAHVTSLPLIDVSGQGAMAPPVRPPIV